MSDRPPIKRASYTLHIATVAGLNSQDNSLLNLLAYVRLLDEVLDLFDTEPRFQHFVLDGEVGPLEDYLSIRPENFERIEELVDEGKLLIGPWYTQSYESSETAIRSLMIGMQTADVFGRPMMVGYMPNDSNLPGYLPQIFRSFGIEVAISGRVDADQSNELRWIGDDGTEILLGQIRQGVVPTGVSILNLRNDAAPYAESGHILLSFNWKMNQPAARRLSLLQSIPDTQIALHDNVFHSHPPAYAKAIQSYAQTRPVPKIHSHKKASTHYGTEFVLTRVLEPLMAWVEALGPSDPEGISVRRPQYLLQQLWKKYLGGSADIETVADWYEQAESILVNVAYHVNTSYLKNSSKFSQVVFNPEDHPVEYHTQTIPPLSFANYTGNSELMPDGKLIIATTGIHEGILPLSASLISVSEQQFRITAAKLPEHPEREGLIVRGYNVSDEDVWITLTPWRPYKTIDVVTMDEEPTGGRLAQESNGAVQFKAAPHRILTCWFHDD